MEASLGERGASTFADLCPDFGGVGPWRARSKYLCGLVSRLRGVGRQAGHRHARPLPRRLLLLLLLLLYLGYYYFTAAY